MNVKRKDTYTLLKFTESSFDDFFQEYEKEHLNFVKNNLVIDFSSLKNINKKNISLFLSYAEIHNNNGTSFVLVCNDIEIEEFPENFNIVPTLIEAEDVIEMEEIQRDLGF